MPRKFLRTYLPNPAELQKRPGLRMLGRHLLDPALWHLNRQSVSTAFAVGIFVAFLPIPAQMLVAAMLAVIVRSNLPISVVLVWISNPVTMGPLLFYSYRTGAWILGETHTLAAFDLSWEWVRARLGQIWAPLLIGSVVLGLVCGAAAWATMQVFWRWHVVQRWERRRNVRRLRAIIAAQNADNEKAATDGEAAPGERRKPPRDGVN